MRFHVKYNDAKIFIGFYPKNHRFVFYTHGKMKSVNDWKKFVDSNKLEIYDEDGFTIDWLDFMKFVDHCQYYSNTKWVNKWFIGKDGYNFSDNRSDNRAIRKANGL